MTHIDLSDLTEKLSPTATTHLEEALNLCLRYQHPCVDMVHLLYCLFESNAFAKAVCSEFPLDHHSLLSTLQLQLEQYEVNEVSVPTLSEQTVHWLKEAWVYSAMQNGSGLISVPALLSTLWQDQQCRQITAFLIPQLKGVSQEQYQLLATPIEKKFMAQDSSTTADTKPPLDVLNRYCTDLTRRAAQGHIDPAIGRDKEIQQVIDILLRRRQNNPLLIGEPGVGKTAIVEGLALAIHTRSIPEKFYDYQVLCLDLSLLLAGAGVKGEFENRLNQVIKAIKNSPQPIILFIDEAHTLIGSGNQAGGMDTANLIKPALARGELRTIAATTWSEYKQYFETDSALARRFQQVKVEEPDDASAISMCRSLQPSLEKHHNVIILDEAIRSAVTLSRRYIAERHLPDKAISLLDTACARVALRKQTKPLVLLEIENKLNLLEQTKKQHAAHLSLQQSDNELKKIEAEERNLQRDLKRYQLRWSQDTSTINELETALNANSTPDKKTIKRLQKKLQQPQCLVPYCVDQQVIESIINDWTGIPIERLNQDSKKRIQSCEHILGDKIKGQANVIDSVLRAIKPAMLQIQDPSKPLGVLFFTGPSGVGKTYLAKTLAEELFGSSDHMTTINLSEFKEEHKVSMLLGAPPGYVGYGQGGVLTEAVRRQPYHVVLLDEIDKAHPGVCDIFYQIFDQGQAKDGQGRTIDFRHTLFIMTSNIGGNVILDNPDSSFEQMKALVEPLLLNHFKTAFLGRCKIIPFSGLSADCANDIIADKLEILTSRILETHHKKITIDNTLIETIRNNSNLNQFGARHFDETIQRVVMPKIMNALLS